MQVLTLILSIAACLAAVTGVILLIRMNSSAVSVKDLREMREFLGQAVTLSAQNTDTAVKHSTEAQNMRLAEMSERISRFSLENEQKLNNIRETTANRLDVLREGNEKKLEHIRLTVEEKLQSTLNERISSSFSLVNERLEQVYKSLGEMNTLAAGVGDLKKVLSGVKTRGILGEIQLSAILEQILSREQYGVNVNVVPENNLRVEFAVKLPGDGENAVWLPVDSKFPSDRYAVLCDAYDSADKTAIDSAIKDLTNSLKASAKDIRDKYIHPPYTTDFAVMFLPFEGLYAEVVRLGLIETLQNEYRVNIAGPTTMAALLSSLQMGFKTLAIQKHSGDVWRVLGEVKSEFNKFADVLASAQKKLEAAERDLGTLATTRTNSILRKLRDVESIDSTEPAVLIQGE